MKIIDREFIAIKFKIIYSNLIVYLMIFKFDLPPISEGYYKIVNFPYWFKNSNLEIYTEIEFEHIIVEYENGYPVEKTQYIDYDSVNIENLLLLKIGDRFNFKGEKLKNKKYLFSVSLESYQNCNFVTSQKNDLLFNSPKSIGTKYYAFEKRNKENKPINVIIPSIVIGQAFFLVNSLIIKNLFQADLTGLTDLVEWSKKEIDNLKIGEISLKKTGTAEVKSMAKALSFFLFSKDDYLMMNLTKMQANLYQKVISDSAKNLYNFIVPIKEKLELVITGSYKNVGDKTFFIASEIVEVKHENNFKDLYETDNIVFFDSSQSNKTSENPSVSNTGSFPIKRRKKKKSSTVTKEGVNDNLAESFIQSGNNLLSGIVNLSIVHKNSEKGNGNPPLYPKDSQFGTFNRIIPDPNSNSGGLSGGKKEEDNNDKNDDYENSFLMIKSIVEKLKVRFRVMREEIDNKKIKIYKLINHSGYTAYLGSDCHSNRIQIFHKANLGEIDNIVLNNISKTVKDFSYNWKKIVDSKESSGILLAQSTNYNKGGTRLEEKEIKEDGTVFEKRVSDLCYRNVQKKLEAIFSYSYE